MVDVLTPAQRQLNMSRIRGKDTKPEMTLRRGLHALGFRFRLHRKDLPGRPDLVFPSCRAVILVHGCFWHGHGCGMFKLPTTRREFWETKITNNQHRDQRNAQTLRNLGWRVMIVWECSLRGPARRRPEQVLAACAAFITSDEREAMVGGIWPDQCEADYSSSARLHFNPLPA